MPAGIHRLATGVWTSLATGAGAGFLARDALGLRQPLVALAWTVGAALPLLALRRPAARRPKRPREPPGGQRGGATIELTVLVLLAALALGALVALPDASLPRD